MRKSVTLKDIASELNVSIVTVSKALSDKEGVGDELREKIKQVAVKLGYQGIVSHKNGKDQKNCNVGIIVAEQFVRKDASFYLKIYQCVVKELAKRGYYGILEIVTPHAESQCIVPNIIADKKVNGIIIIGQLCDAYIEMVQSSSIPFLFMDYYDPHKDVDAVVFDNLYGMYLLTDYLISEGHKNIGYVGNVLATPSILDRYLGFCRALIKHQIPLVNEWLIDDRDENGDFIEFVLPKEMPTAFVCNCDETAYLLTSTLTKLGYRLPEEISVVGFDNYIYAELSTPKLTTVEVDIDVMSVTAAESIIRKITDKGFRLGRKEIHGKIVVRDSVMNMN